MEPDIKIKSSLSHMIDASTTVFYETFWSFVPQYIVVQKLAITLFTSLLFQTL